ncbi:MAG: hypothetical protein CM15mP23_20150 [Cryomorphaceae bacterium]|nr:MAG: hypothetical protein CM15mP23_20150 [Cryomorphaceae bacterium]
MHHYFYRISSIKHANQIILLNEGEIIEKESQYITKNNGEYTKIFKKQLAESK